MNNYQHHINVLIAQTLEALQDLNPDLYATRYGELYMIADELKPQVWNVTKLHQIEQDLIDNAR